MPMNAAESLLSVGDDGRTALECGEARVTYAELRDAVCRAAGAWRRLGLETGDRVLVYAPDSIDWVIAYLSAIWAGGVAIGLNSRLFEKELSVVLADSGARFVFCDSGGVAMLRRLRRLRRDDSPAPRILVQEDARALWSSAAAIRAEQLPDDSHALWIYTSGTTGLPKGVIHAQRTVIESASFAKSVLGVDAGARIYATSKLFFAYALGSALFAGLRVGGTVILDSEWTTAERAAQIVEGHRPTVMYSVPTLYLKMLKISGQWVSVIEVEQSLMASAAGSVQQLAAVGHTGGDGLGSIALFVVAAAGREHEARERIEAGIAALPKIKRPRLVKWIAEIPVTATGKLQRRKLKDLYLADAFA